MTHEESAALNALVMGSLTYSELAKMFPEVSLRGNQRLLKWLGEAAHKRDPERLDAVMQVLWHYESFDTSYTLTLCEIGEEDWHDLHEDVVSMLQEIRDPRSVEALFRIANSTHLYLEYDDAYALAAKCCYALRDIGDEHAHAKLASLANDSRDPVRVAARKLTT